MTNTNSNRPKFDRFKWDGLPSCWSVPSCHFRVYRAGTIGLHMYCEDNYIGLMDPGSMAMIWESGVGFYRIS